MIREVTVKLGKTRSVLQVERRTVVLCDTAAAATRMAKAFAEEGVLIDGADAPRGTVRDQLPKRFDANRAIDICAALRRDESVLDWRPRESGALQRMVAATVVALAHDAQLLVFDLAGLAGSPFDVAHACAHMRRTSMEFDVTVVAVIADPALISSAGAYLIVCAGDVVVESGPVETLLARPASDTLLARLEATPIASPVAMQMRRVQRMATQSVNYAHTTIIHLPTQDSIALAGGDE